MVNGVTFNNRETEVLKLLVQGCSNYEIAKALHLSEHTIQKTHFPSIYKKAGITGNDGGKTRRLFAFLIQSGLLKELQ